MTQNPLDQDDIRRFVHAFYDEVRADVELAPIFGQAIPDAQWPAHLDRMVEFWSTVMLGTRDFQGNVYGKHMALSGVQPRHFDRWLELFRAVTGRLFAPSLAGEFELVANRIANSLHFGFFGRMRDEKPA